jgi:flagellar basal body rod protein FlgF
VRLANVSQQFTQGDVNNTGNVLDMGIQGNGFFILSDNGSLSTRAGVQDRRPELRGQQQRQRVCRVMASIQRQDHQGCVD